MEEQLAEMGLIAALAFLYCLVVQQLPFPGPEPSARCVRYYAPRDGNVPSQLRKGILNRQFEGCLRHWSTTLP